MTLDDPAPDPDTRPPAVIYVRISDDRDGERAGVDRQMKDCEAYAERTGFRVVHTYVDNDVSAFKVKPRPQHRKMMSDVAVPGAPMTIIVWHLDRLHRSSRELEQLITHALTHDVRVHAVHGGVVDLATPEGRMQARIYATIAGYEVEHRSDRVKNQRRH